jgi:RNA polymerase primary sigma factor
MQAYQMILKSLLLLSLLTAWEREVLRLRYGLGLANPLTLKECGLVLGITRECVRQMELRAIKKLQNHAVHPLE